jgi:hypothetical protein
MNCVTSLQKLVIFGAGILVFCFLIIPVIPQPRADSNNPGIFSVNSRPYGFDYGEWSAKWWQWSLQIPSSTNPITDKTGAHCAQSQIGPVWYLAGSLGSPAFRGCIIPAGKAIFFPVLAVECSTAEDSTLRTESQLRSCAVSGVEGGITAASVDGVNLQALQMYRIQSPLFYFTFPSPNIFGAASGLTPSVSDGYFVMLQPLSIGNHTLHFTGVQLANPTIGTESFATEATYHITVK